MIATAPLYTGKRVRTHTTNIGRILCTGKGCIGCSAKRLRNKSIGEILGDVDTVDFGTKRAEFDVRHGSSALVSRPITAPGCYGNEGHGYFGPKVEHGKIRQQSRRKENNYTNGIVSAHGLENSAKNGRRIGNDNVRCKAKGAQMRRSVLTQKADCLQRESDAKKQYGRELSPSLLNHRRRKNARSLTRNGESLLDLKTGRAKPDKTNIPRGTKLSFTAKPHFLGMMRNSEGGKEESTQGQNTVKITPKMSFLEMLQKSEAGIYDVDVMEERKTSRWVSKILEAGVCSEKELLPRIPSAKAAKCGLYKGRVQVSNLPRITLNDRFLYEGEDTVIVIEHEKEGRIRTDESLHQLSFVVECSSVRRSLPRFSVLDIAEGLGKLVSMDSVQIIQRKGRKWHILVKGNCVRDFLMQHGVVVKGRRLQMIETAAH